MFVARLDACMLVFSLNKYLLKVSEFLFALLLDGFVVNVPDVVVRFSLNDEFVMGEYDSLLGLLSTLLIIVVVFNEFKEGDVLMTVEVTLLICLSLGRDGDNGEAASRLLFE